jgi:hypothetical protein
MGLFSSDKKITQVQAVSNVTAGADNGGIAVTGDSPVQTGVGNSSTLNAGEARTGTSVLTVAAGGSLTNETRVSNDSYTFITDNDAMAIAGEVSRQALSTGAQSVNDGFDFAGKITVAALNSSENMLHDSILGIGNTAMAAMDSANRSATIAQSATQNAMEFASNATRADASLTVENMVKYATIAATLISVAMLFRGRKSA